MERCYKIFELHSLREVNLYFTTARAKAAKFSILTELFCLLSSI